MNHLNPYKATLADLDGIKSLYDQHKRELGFVLRPSLVQAIESQELIIIANDGLLGAVHYHHRCDGQTTLYHIAVDSNKRQLGVGRSLVNALRNECKTLKMEKILLKCPVELPANAFYKALGFKLVITETGKHRQLNIWVDDQII
ncbi:GNAT family N-acetyltransferase [Aggregatilineales bacterium SYSU G02658]